MLLDVADFGNSDFLEILKRRRPELYAAFSTEVLSGVALPKAQHYTSFLNLLKGTTVLAVVYNEGVIIAGDRQAVEGFQVGERRIQKVYEVDDHSAIAIAGVAGPCIEMAKLFQVQVEFYEKTEGATLSLEGKANYLSNMVKLNLGMALQGLYVIPIFAGYDPKEKQARIFKYDVTGGRYEEADYHAVGSGGKDAQTTLKKRYCKGMSRDEILKVVVEALWDAADEDLGTGGPDLIRGIFPTIKIIDQTGVSDIPDSEVKGLYAELIESLREM